MLLPNEVQLWLLPLDQPGEVAHLNSLLAPEEQARAQRFLRPDHQCRFVVGRGLLRTLLGHYLAVEPQCLKFAYSPHGKPFVSWPPTNLTFNLSHSNALALYAFTLQRAIGVDLEQINKATSVLRLAERFLAPSEQLALQNLAPPLQTEAFFTCWTRKEAYLKARGTGLALPLNRFAVAVGPTEPARLLSVEGEPAEPTRWTFQALNLASGYAATLVGEGSGWQLNYGALL